MKKIVFMVLILAVVGAAAYSFDARSFPDPIGKGSVLINPTFSLGGVAWGGWGVGRVGAATLGPSLSVDFALPINFGLMVGAEFSALFVVSSLGSKYFPASIPILARVSWHPNFEVRGLDPYVRFKIGGNIAAGGGLLEYESEDWKADWKGGFAFGFNVGCRYFFNDIIGIFGDLGYTWYGLKYTVEYKGKDHYYNDNWGWDNMRIPIYTVFHLGATIKVGGKSSGSSGGKAKSESSSRSSSKAVYRLVNADSLNVRSGPSADNALVGQLTRGTRVQVLDSSGTWWKIKSGNIEGYVSSAYLKEE